MGVAEMPWLGEGSALFLCEGQKGVPTGMEVRNGLAGTGGEEKMR